MLRGNDRASRPHARTSAPGTDVPRRRADDPLSDALRHVRLTGAAFFVWEVSSPFALAVPDGRRFAAAILPGAGQIASYHVVVEGSCWASGLGEEPRRLVAGDVLLIPRGAPYVIGSSEASCRATPVDEPVVVAFFRAMACGDLPFVVRDGGGAEPRARLVCGFLGCDVRPFNPVVASLADVSSVPLAAAGTRLRALVDHAVAEAGAPEPGSFGVLTRLGELMYLEALRRCVDTAPGERGWLAAIRDVQVGRCLSLLHRAPERRWSLDELAHEVGLSRSALARRFAELVGETPMRYLARWRLQRAAILLRDPGAKVATVAERVGYGSAPALSRAFKREVGLSPALWRQREAGGGGSPSPSPESP